MGGGWRVLSGCRDDGYDMLLWVGMVVGGGW